MNTCRFITTVALCAMSACSTYDFAMARKPDGTYDIPKLIAELESSGRHCIDDGLWIRLVHTNFLTFEKNAPGLPPGYTFAHLKGYGPLFFAGTTERRVVTPKGEPIEWGDREWAGCGLLWHERDDYVTTTSGTRHEQRERFAILFGDTDVTYTPATR